MEGHELDYNSMMEDSRNMIIKGKRTKRQRSSSPLALTMASTSSTTTDQDYADTVPNPNNTFFNMPTTSIDFTRSVLQENDDDEEEEEDMANCLILLAQGQGQSPPPPNKSAVVETSGFYVYECKTCNRGFSSFQALGGHRASHRKPPKPTSQEKSKPTMDMVILKQDDCTALSLNLGLKLNNPSGSMKVITKVHECSICGAEFGSGQALGGHMRRHRSMVTMAATNCGDHSADHDGYQESKKPKVVLSLDLNLPAPVEDDHHRETKFPFRSKDQLIVFSNSSLVRCHF